MTKFDTTLNLLLSEKNMQGNYYHVIDNLQQHVDNYRRGYIPMSFSGTNAERSINRDYPYYLSVSRVPYNDYRRNNGRVTLVLDATKINQKYKTTPVNYYNFQSRKERNEAEDRILSQKDKLDFSYVKEVHVDLSTWREENPDPKMYSYFETAFAAQEGWMNYYFYLDRKDYNIMNTANAFTYDELFEALDMDVHDTTGRATVTGIGVKFSEFVEFLMDGGKNADTKAKKHLRRNIGSWRDDTKISFMNEIHNAHRQKNDDVIQSELRHLLRYMKREFGTTNFEEFINKWLDKYWVYPKR